MTVVDEYIELSKEYAENPTDTDLLNEMTELGSKWQNWQPKHKPFKKN